jgi:MFS family permease
MSAADASTSPHPIEVPTLPLMHAGFVLAGLATFLLGPILPLLSRQWNLSDQRAGLLLLAQFTGATLGGATVSRRLPQAFLTGLLCAAIGFGVFALAPGLVLACLGLLLGGFGAGRIIASVNIIAGNRFTEQRGSALSPPNPTPPSPPPPPRSSRGSSSSLPQSSSSTAVSRPRSARG